MKMFTAALSTETNSFVPFAVPEASFRTTHDSDIPLEVLVVRRWVERANAEHQAIRVGLCAVAEPSGTTPQPMYDRLRDEIIDAVEADVDIILLALHGAMMATECDDCEGDLLTRLRDRLGGRPVIGVMLDPHCHLTPTMAEHADLIVVMREYPHTDFLERADELYDLAVATREGRIVPTSAVFDCRMIGFFPTDTPEMREVIGQLEDEISAPGMLTASLVHGFPWGDTASAGTKIYALADGRRDLARACADRLGRAIYEKRDALLPHMPTIEQMLDNYALRSSGCLVIADTGDNPGGGAPGDNVTLLRALIERRVENAIFGCVVDPDAVSQCAVAGLNSAVTLVIGGKCGPASGPPLTVKAKVMGLLDSHSQTGLGNTLVDLGRSAWVRCGGVEVAIISKRTQTFAPDAFTGLGIDVSAASLIAVKSSQHFRQHFAEVGTETVRVATPGALQMDFSALPYVKRDGCYHPRVADPLRIEISTFVNASVSGRSRNRGNIK